MTIKLTSASQVEKFLLDDSCKVFFLAPLPRLTPIRAPLVTQSAVDKATRRGPSGGDSIDELLNTVGIQYTQ